MAEDKIPTKTLPEWTEKKILDQFEHNNLNQQIFEARYDKNQSAFKTIKQMFMDKYSYDVMGGKTGPYLAVVLEVLSGPQVNNAASTNNNKTNTANFKSMRDPSYQSKEDALKDPPIRVIARVPEFDMDIDWPKDKKDAARIASHSEFHQMYDDSTINKVDQITVGSSIWIVYNNTENLTGMDTQAPGKIIGLQSLPSQPIKLNLKQSAKNIYNPPCKSVVHLRNPAGGVYVSKTVAELHGAFKLPAIKLKNRIKTGVYGNGTPQTKIHFDEALKKSYPSVKHGIPGAAPDSRNAFIWVGHLKNNGYMDILDRPITPGRETIIYAPMMLDLSSPIEIKYYFHDASGFGHSWINGPDTTIDNVKSAADTIGNDFKEKIGPGIKDLIKDKRNFVLVIPEMAHSRGYGTTNGATGRFTKISKGQKTSDVGEKQGITIRTILEPEITSLAKNYLRNLPTTAFYQEETLGFFGGEEALVYGNLLQMTHLREREKATFDGSYSGGNFGFFHQEVIDVLNEHLGNIDDKINYISILADGLGAISLASMVQDIPSAPSHKTAVADFRGVKINRIDYIDSGDDLVGSYGFSTSTTNGSPPPGGPASPSYVIYNDYLQLKALDPDLLEFNYITDLVEPRSLYSRIGLDGKYTTDNKEVSDYGEQKFSFFVDPNEASATYVSLHMAASGAGKKVGYAFGMVNTFLVDIKNLPLIKQSDSDQRPSFAPVPDHASAIATKPSLADVSSQEKELKTLGKKINFFEKFLIDYANDPGGICTKPEYAIFCRAGTPIAEQAGSLFATYTTYLQNKRRFIELSAPDGLIISELALKKNENNTEALGADLADAKAFLADAKAFNKNLGGDGLPPGVSNMIDAWKDLNSFPPKFLIKWENSIQGGQLINYITAIAINLAKEDAYSKIVPKIENAIAEASPEAINRPEGCEPPPRRLREFTGAVIPAFLSSEDDIPEFMMSCRGKNIRVANNYEELVTMIPWFPEQDDFTYEEEDSRFSKDNSDIEEIGGGFDTTTFKYKARAAFGNFTYHKSPPIWSCISNIISEAWERACVASNYIPFNIVTGIKGSFKKKGVTAYKAGIPLSTFGLAISVDPPITGYSTDGDPIHSIFTGAWTPGFVNIHAKELYDLGVFYDDNDSFWGGAPYIDNAYKDYADGTRRKAEDWYWASHSYNGDLVAGEEISTFGSELKDAGIDYDDIMEFAKEGPIVQKNSNPVLWLLTFCERSGMKWGNSQFLRRRHRGGVVWNSAEQTRIAAIYGIPDIVARINAISWEDEVIENHMHFQYYGGASLIKWSEINSVRAKLGK